MVTQFEKWPHAAYKCVIAQPLLIAMRLTDILKQALKTIIKPFNAPEKNPGNTADGLLFNMDRLILYEDIVDGLGWLFHKYLQVSGVAFSVKIGKSYHDFPCNYGTPRPDVAAAYNFDSANSSGLNFLCRLPQGKPADFLLKISFADGRYTSVNVMPVTINRSSWSRMQLIRRWINFAWSYAVRGDYRGLLRYVLTAIKKFIPHSKEERLRFSSFLNKSGGPVTLIVDHNIGGGANQFRKQWISARMAAGHRLLLLYYDVQSSMYCLQPFGWADEELFTFESMGHLAAVMKNLKTREILLNEVYSYEDPLAVVAWVSALKEKTQARLTVAVHDYFMVCPSYTLLDKNGRFCGIPDIKNCRECLPHHYGDFICLAANRNVNRWRTVWGMCLKNADVFLCFSNSSQRILRLAYPQLDPAKFEVRPHTVDYLPGRKVNLNMAGPLNIGIVGTINIHKGVEIVNQMAGIIESKQLPVSITVIGELVRVQPNPIIKITGRYERRDLPDLLENNGINISLLPSICSETFSYVTEELIQLNVPLAVFNLGAPADRVSAYTKGLIIDKIDAEYALNEIISFYERLRKPDIQSTGGVISQ